MKINRRQNMLVRLGLLGAMGFLCVIEAGAEEMELSVTARLEGGSGIQSAVVVDLHSVEGLSFSVESAVVEHEGKDIAYQLDDLDGDGNNDELCFLDDLIVCKSKTYQLKLSSERSQTKYPALVYGDIMLNDKKGKHPLIIGLEAPGESDIYNDLYHHGAEFESELTGYRIYFDHRQNIDLYGKRQKRLELEETHFYTSASQQSLGYGNDVLWAGQSIGCGSLKLWDGIEAKNWTNVYRRSQRLICSGPLRTIVEVCDLNARVDSLSTTYNVRTLYTMYGGHREVRVDIFLDRPIATPFLCTGVQRIGASDEAFSTNGGVKSEGYVRSDGLAVSWGCDYPEMSKKDQFAPEEIGLAVRVPSEYVVESKIDSLNYLLVLGRPGQQHIYYYLGFSAIKEDFGYHSSADWFSHVESWTPGTVDVKVFSATH